LLRVSVDVGGTFTDLVSLDEETGELVNIKVPSVPTNPEEGVINAFKMFLDGKKKPSIRMVGHATTIATNALFGQIDLRLPRIGLITTKGFRDVIEIGRQRRAEVYNLFFQRPTMLVERRQRYEVEERIGADGEVLVPLNLDDVEKALRNLEDEGVESLAIGLINSYVNGSHEVKILEMARQCLPKVNLSASSQVSGGYREYERFSTAVVNAVLIPIIHTYVSQLALDLKVIGVSAPLYVMQSNGGMATAELVAEKPVTIVESGPASGVMAAAWLGDLIDKSEVISFDMGGTTAKAGTVRERVPEVVPEYEVAGKVHMGRLLKGSGYPVRYPFIDLAECSAGGGTIAWVDEGGALNVGPTSAGANPGPACYGKGGSQPTITDANLVLGRLNPENLLDGSMRIYQRNARLSLKKLGVELDMGVEEVAASVVRISNSMMSKILRIVSVERGFDPRRFTLVAFGGAGPMHACPLAAELDIQDILVPPNPGMFSALGLLTADLFQDYSRPLVSKIDDVDSSGINVAFEEMEEEGRVALLSEGVEPGDISLHRRIDLRYLGQSYELTVDANVAPGDELMSSVASRYHKRHEEIYGYSAPNEPVEVVNIRLRAIGLMAKPCFAERAGPHGYEGSVGRRLVYFEDDNSWVETPVYSRSGIGEGFSREGPAVIEQYDSTTVVYPGWDIRVDQFGVLHLRRGG
jgi:N-methylhydantoinase A